jgi:hypothetical protein
MRGLCPFHSEKTPSFDVHNAKGIFFCRGCGATGDVIAFVMRHDGLTFPEAVALLGGGGPLPAPDPAVLRRREAERARLLDRERLENDREIAKARALCGEAKPAAGTLVDVYFEARGILRDCWPEGFPPTLRYIPDLPYWYSPEGQSQPQVLARLPAMIGLMQDAQGRVCAAHITYLRPDGSGKAEVVAPDTGEILPAKKMRGRPWGSAIRLTKADNTRPLGIAEGIENGATILQATAGELAVWVAGSLDNIGGRGEGVGMRHPTRTYPDGRPVRLPSHIPDPERPGMFVPQEVREIIILADNDSGDPAAAEMILLRAQTRWQAERRSVRVAWPDEGADFNDMARRGAA